MKVLVFAHVPPPLHGQSAMVRTLIEGLRGDPEITIVHVDARLSRDSADIGRWRPGKFFHLTGACLRALRLRIRHGRMHFYYVPAPSRRAALYRDWWVLLLCRPFFSGLVLHWHAVGLGAWLATRATAPERWITQLLLGRAALALVLAPELAMDAKELAPQRVAIVPNGVPDPGPIRPPPRAAGDPCRILFLGLASRAKGLFDTLDAVALVQVCAPGKFHLTIAGSFPSPAEEQEFRARAASLDRTLVDCVGPVDEVQKHRLLASSDLFCFPTSYLHEGQPLTLMEALSHDLPIITTRWRAIPGMLPKEHVSYVAPGQPGQLAEAMIGAQRSGRSNGNLRQHYLAHFTVERHLTALRAALLSLRCSRCADQWPSRWRRVDSMRRRPGL